jgi:hypothetical protein
MVAGARRWTWFFRGLIPAPSTSPAESTRPPDDAVIASLDSSARLGAHHADVEIRLASKAMLHALERYARRQAAPVSGHSP